jgi:ribosomal protein L7/L12
MTTITDKATKAISHMDSSRAARLAGDIGSAESALEAARRILIEVAGELTGADVTDVRSLTNAQLSALLEVARREVDCRAREGTAGLLTEDELAAVRRRDKLSAIKSIRDRTGLRLVDAREYLERAIRDRP